MQQAAPRLFYLYQRIALAVLWACSRIECSDPQFRLHWRASRDGEETKQWLWLQPYALNMIEQGSTSVDSTRTVCYRFHRSPNIDYLRDASSDDFLTFVFMRFLPGDHFSPHTSCRWPSSRFSQVCGGVLVSRCIINRSRDPLDRISLFHARAPTRAEWPLSLFTCTVRNWVMSTGKLIFAVDFKRTHVIVTQLRTIKNQKVSQNVNRFCAISLNDT